MYRATTTQTSPICGALDLDSRQQNKIRIQKDQLKIGSILHYYGKDAPNTRWEICDVWYIHPGTMRKYSHNKVHYLKDILVLYCFFTKTKRLVSFRHISKSPLWRLQ
jgi:hypothetical protein